MTHQTRAPCVDTSVLVEGSVSDDAQVVASTVNAYAHGVNITSQTGYLGTWPPGCGGSACGACAGGAGLSVLAAACMWHPNTPVHMTTAWQTTGCALYTLKLLKPLYVQ